MRPKEIIEYRLHNQQISSTKFTRPEEIVSWMGVVQSQLYGMAKWAIGLRLPGSTDKQIDAAFNEGRILRTHVFRPTLHFVSPEDIRWMLRLSAPRLQALLAHYYKRTEVDIALRKKCIAVLIKSLEGGKQLTRSQLQVALKKSKVVAEKMRLAFLMMNAEIEGIICSGRRIGSQFTYALLDERVPSTKIPDREESLSLLTHRYFTSRGPATAHDFAWWSGLTVTDARKGIAMLDKDFESFTKDDKEYFYKPVSIDKKNALNKCFLLPDYDEYGIAYKDRSVMVDEKIFGEKIIKQNVYKHFFILDGIIAGIWETKKESNARFLTTTVYSKLSKEKNAALKKARDRYTSFMSH